MRRRITVEEPKSSEITLESDYLRRRDFLRRAGLFTATSAAWGSGLIALTGRGEADPPKPPPAAANVPPLRIVQRGRFGTDEPKTSFDDVTTYNNFYELGVSKSEPARQASHLRSRPWTVRIDGEVEKTRDVDIDQLLSWFELEERVYRLRCVEAWSMVIPWIGFPLADLIAKVRPTSRAKYVEFTSLLDPSQLPGQDDDVLPWPYVEGLRIDEATNPLTLIAVGLYDRILPGQNGAPLRIVVPWKYGFKSAKSVVRIRFTETEPRSTWHRVAPSEYGFYANVNPIVDHPRWSQATERRIGWTSRRPTLAYNGYAKDVAHLYRGMDLAKDF
jgi:sulfoxide reductase catalytic subunit YedY